MCKVDLPFNLDLSSKKILNSCKIKSEYQPLICTKKDSVYAYEALARFELNGKNIPPQKIFETIHDDLDSFFELENKLKKIQFKNRPKDSKLFINFDPHIFLKKDKIDQIFQLFLEQNDFVVELVENSHSSINVNQLLNIFNKYQLQFAVDDFFKENSMISTYLLNSCNYVKLDKDILKELKRNDRFFHIVDGIIKFAHSLDKQVVLEGVETQEDLKLAKRRDIDLVQGFLFKDRFILKA